MRVGIIGVQAVATIFVALEQHYLIGNGPGSFGGSNNKPAYQWALRTKMPKIE